MHLMLFAVVSLIAVNAWAAAVSPISWEGLSQLGPILLVALFGGLVSFISKVRSGATRMWNFSEFAGDMFTSGVSGVVFYWLCRGFELNEWVTAAIVGMAGHAGSRGIFMLEKWIEQKFGDLRLKP